MGIFETIVALFVLVVMVGFAYVILSIFYDIISYDFIFEPLATTIKVVIAIAVIVAIVQSV
jgi:hypothetical protein